jgi:hypothetical protein
MFLCCYLVACLGLYLLFVWRAFLVDGRLCVAVMWLYQATLFHIQETVIFMFTNTNTSHPAKYVHLLSKLVSCSAYSSALKTEVTSSRNVDWLSTAYITLRPGRQNSSKLYGVVRDIQHAWEKKNAYKILVNICERVNMFVRCTDRW